MSLVETVLKRPAEEYVHSIEYVGRLPSGASLVSASCSAIRLFDNSADNTVLDSLTATVSGTQVLVQVQSGTAGHDYRITVLATISTGGSPIEDSFTLQVRNAP